ncbi:MAG: hypothetical protein ACXABY_16125 [Candidatus Thorarchaeota archaeon]|jgi:hypothetical protein
MMELTHKFPGSRVHFEIAFDRVAEGYDQYRVEFWLNDGDISDAKIVARGLKSDDLLQLQSLYFLFRLLVTLDHGAKKWRIESLH